MGEALPCKREDLSSNPRTYAKPDSVVQVCNPSISVMRRERSISSGEEETLSQMRQK